MFSNTDYSEQLETLKKSLSCSECNTFQLILRRLSNCSHLLCDSCFKISGACYVCTKKHTAKNLQLDSNLISILSHVNGISNIYETSQKADSIGVSFLFSPDTFEYKRHHNGETRLHKECRSGNIQEVRVLVESGMDVNVQDFAGWTPLHEAVLNQRVDIVKLLLKHGALVNVPGLDYLTPLHSAVQEKNIEIIKTLIEHGANCAVYNKNGKTPLDLCDDADLTSLICITPTLHSITRSYTIPALKLFLHNVDKNIDILLSTNTDITLLKKHNLLNFGDVNYFIVGDNKPDVKYLQAAMLQGACVVTLEFVNDLIFKNVVINPTNYFANLPNFAICKAGLNALNKLPKLFDGINFFLANQTQTKIGNVVYSANDLKMFIRLGGGKIDSRSPIGSHLEEHYPYHTNKMSNYAYTNYYILYDESKKNFKKKNCSKEIRYQSAKWLIDCINNFTIL